MQIPSWFVHVIICILATFSASSVLEYMGIAVGVGLVGSAFGVVCSASGFVCSSSRFVCSVDGVVGRVIRLSSRAVSFGYTDLSGS